MNAPVKVRRIGWLAALSICLALYTLLHIKVNAVHSDVVRAERQIVQLERHNLLLETEFLTRSSQVQLAKLNRINFGFRAPRAEQFVDNERQLAQFGSPRAEDAPAPIRLAGMSSEEGVPPFPKLVSPLTGDPIDEALVEGEAPATGRLAISIADPQRSLRVPIAGLAGDLAR